MQITYDPVEHNHIISTARGTVIIGRFCRNDRVGVDVWERGAKPRYIVPTVGTDLSRRLLRAFGAAFSCDPARVREAFA